MLVIRYYPVGINQQVSSVRKKGRKEGFPHRQASFAILFGSLFHEIQLHPFAFSVRFVNGFQRYFLLSEIDTNVITFDVLDIEIHLIQVL